MTPETDCPSHIEARERLQAEVAAIPDDVSADTLWLIALDARDWRTLLDTPTQEGVGREEIARIIDGDPDIWMTDPDDEPQIVRDRIERRRWEAYRKADAILALFPPCETAGGEVERADPGAGETADLIATAQKMARRMGTEFVVDPDKVARYGTGPGVTTPSPASTSSGEPHPEDTCEDCGRDNPVWFAPSPLWNLVMGGPEAQGDPGGIVCPVCFVQRAEAADVRPTAWVVTPEGEPAPGAPEGWPEIAHPHRPPSAFTERAYLRRQIERVGEETAVVGTLCTTAMASDSRGSLSGYLWAIAEWAQGQIAKTSDAALTSSSAKPGGEEQ